MRGWMMTGACAAALALPCSAALAQDAPPGTLGAALERLDRQQAQLDRQAAEIAELRRMIQQGGVTPPAPAIAAAQGAAPGIGGDPAGVQTAPVPLERVGDRPADFDQPIELAVLETQGSVVTRKGQLTGEFQLEYARADRNRALFRGIELVEAVLVGVFDINESQQDVLTGSVGLRYGLTNRLEIGARLPYVYRSDKSVIAPIPGSTMDDDAATIDNSTRGNGIGDVELSARYQLFGGRNGSPYLIANLQAVLPTGRDPFTVKRDGQGRALQATTGAGFYGISPSLTMILPSDPVVLFGTLGYTFNLPRSVDTTIPPVHISYVDPGDAISASAGIGISFNQRTTLNLGYAHSWAFGTKTRSSLIMPTQSWPDMRETTSRDLQIGRLLFGVTYRVSDRASVNWSVEVGATEDATDVRTVLRIPLVLLSGG